MNKGEGQIEESGKLFYLNNAWAEFWGMVSKELVGLVEKQKLGIQVKGLLYAKVETSWGVSGFRIIRNSF